MQSAHKVMCEGVEPGMDGEKRRTLTWVLLGWCASGTSTALRAQPAPVRVAAASYLKFALDEILQDFRKQTGLAVQASYGSSGNFARQIQQGLPVDLFLSADESWVDMLAKAGRTRKQAAGHDRGVEFGRGRLVLYVAPGVALDVDARLEGLKRDWRLVHKFAIANPAHAPYGQAAREALQKLGLWQLVAPKLVVAENVAQAGQFVATGAAQAGLTALALVRSPVLAGQGRYIEVDETLYASLRQRMVLTRDAAPQAVKLYDYLQGAQAQQVLKKYGAGH